MLQEPGHPIDLAAANKHGQQLFFANTHGRSGKNRITDASGITPRPPASGRFQGRVRKHPLPSLSQVATGSVFSPVPWRQLSLLDLDLDPAAVITRAGNVDDEWLRYCDKVAVEHGRQHGWSTKQINDVRRGLRLLHVLQHTPGTTIDATDVLKLPRLQDNLSAASTLDVLAAAGLLKDDRLTSAERYFNKQTAGLPEPMTTQLRSWFEVMIGVSDTAPRRHPRDPETLQWQLAAIAPILRVWASTGHDSLASIDRDHVTEALPPAGAARHLADQGLRSLFGVLKARKIVFVNPTRGVPVTASNTTIPMPLDAAAIRDALDSPDPATALAVALVAFHALTARQVRAIQLTDIVDGRLNLAGRVIPLAAPVLLRLSGWLDHRAQTWSMTRNPHLFINRRTAPRLTAVSRPFPWRHVQFSARELREDRILEEVRATGGDLRRINELFGLSVTAGMRYSVATVSAADERPGDNPPAVPRTEDNEYGEPSTAPLGSGPESLK